MTRRLRSDSGAALPMALVFIAVFGMLVALMLQYVGANLKTTAGVAQSLSNLTAADAAADGAFDQLKEDPLVGADPYSSSCFTIPSGQLANVGTVSSTCTARTGSGSFTAPAVTSQPSEAIRTTGAGAATEGLALTAGRQTYVQGDIATRTLSGSGGLNVLGGTGDISATTCSQTGVVAPAPVCGATTPIDPANDPNSATAASWAYPVATSVDRTAPTCGSSWLMSWTPGRYSSGAAFTTAMACASRVHWFQPGIYYLDFSDPTTAAKQIALSLGTTSQIVAGVPLGWDPNAPSKPTIPGPTAAAPTSSACDSTLPGVVFVLGQDASFTVNNGSVQMCGWWDTANPGQHFSIIAPNADITNPRTTTTSAPATVADVTGTAPGKWAAPGASGSLASWVGGTTQTGFLLLTFPTLSIPANATITGITTTFNQTLNGPDASLRSDLIDAAMSNTSATGYKPLPAGNPFLNCVPCTDNLTTRTVSYNLAQAGLTWPTPAELNGGASGLRIRFQLDRNSGTINEYLWSASVVVSYDVPVLTRSTASTTVLTVNGDGLAATPTTVAIHGTVYAPGGLVNLNETNVVTTMVDRGIVARSMTSGLTRASAYAGPLVAVASFTAAASVPNQAILATGSANATEGLTIPASTGTTIQGPVNVSPSLAVPASSSLTVTNGRARATSCNPSSPGVTRSALCSSAAPIDPAVDPALGATEQAAWGSPVPSAYPDVRAVPACTAPLTTLTPGTYTSGLALKTLLTTCANAAIWFQPGVYNFDFLDVLPTDHKLTIAPPATSAVVGGVRSVSWAVNTVPAAPTVGTSACDPDTTGVVFILNADSRIDISSGNVQICGAYATAPTSQHVAVYGVAANSTADGGRPIADPTVNPVETLATTTWTGEASAKTLDGVYATGTFAAAGTSGRLQATFAPYAIPSDATNVTVTATVVHRPTNNSRGTVTATFVSAANTETGGGVLHTCTSNTGAAGCNGTNVYTEAVTTVDNTLIGAIGTGLKVNVYLARTGTSTMATGVDVVRLTISYTGSYNALSGTNAALPYTSGSLTNTAVFRIAGPYPTLKAVVHGTIYAISGAVDISQTLTPYTVVDRGIVARDVYVGATPATATSPAVISVPWKPRAPRSVDVVVTLNATVVLRATVDFTDSSGLFDGDIPVVRRWSHLD